MDGRGANLVRELRNMGDGCVEENRGATFKQTITLTLEMAAWMEGRGSTSVRQLRNMGDVCVEENRGATSSRQLWLSLNLLCRANFRMQLRSGDHVTVVFLGCRIFYVHLLHNS